MFSGQWETAFCMVEFGVFPSIRCMAGAAVLLHGRMEIVFRRIGLVAAQAVGIPAQGGMIKFSMFPCGCAVAGAAILSFYILVQVVLW
jgi:hypothetical protein